VWISAKAIIAGDYGHQPSSGRCTKLTAQWISVSMPIPFRINTFWGANLIGSTQQRYATDQPAADHDDNMSSCGHMYRNKIKFAWDQIYGETYKISLNSLMPEIGCIFWR
jgi:hypothetical protein